MKPAVLFKSLLTAVLILAFTAVAFGQTAELSGVIRDKSEAVIPSASITATNQATGIKRLVTSNKEGVYSIPFLSPGIYRLTVQANGFQGVSRAGINLEVGQRASLDFSLDIGKVETTVEVSGEAPLLSTNSGVGTVMNRQFVANLPLNGRSFQSLILLTPGAVITGPGADAGLLSVNGQRGNANYFMVDGVGANIGVQNNGTAGSSDAMAGMAPGLSAFGGTNNMISIDALEEFKIQTSTYTAELGRQPGGQISLVTRSGANQFHGMAFEYLRNELLDARSFFATAKPPLRQNQFGGTFSGPIFKDKTFFFFSYEGQRLRLPVSGVYQVPSLRLRQIAAPALKTIMAAYPVPDPSTPELVNATTKVPLGFTNYNYSMSGPGTMDAYSIRLDHTFSSKLTLFGRYNQSPSSTYTPNPTTLTTPSPTDVTTRTFTLGANSTLTSRLNNEFRFNFSSLRSNRYYKNVPFGGASPISLADLITGYTGGAGKKFGSVLVYFNSYRSLLYLGDSNDSFQRQFNIVDNVSLVKGSHQFKFGIDYRRLTPIWGPVEYQRLDYFQSEADVIKGIVTSSSIYSGQGARPIFTNFSAYAQDTWKLSPRLMLDLGLRWELNPAPRDANGVMPAKAVGVVGNDVTKATLAPVGTPFFKTFYTAFAPRFGAAYQLRQASGRETVLRGGFGVYYDLGNGPAARAFQYSPFSQSLTRTAVPFPMSAASAAPPPIPTVPTLPISGNTSSDDPNLKLPYTLQWSVALEQSLGTQQSLSLSYVASAARRLILTKGLNFVNSGTRPNPNFNGIMYYNTNGPTADYHSLQVQYKARLKRGLQALVNYTWSHAVDDVSNEWSGFYLEHGNADFDLRHNFSAAVTYNFPKLNSTGALGEPAGRVLKAIVNNWFADGIVHAQSGLPVDVTGTTFAVDGVYFYSRPDQVLGVPFYLDDPKVAGGRRFNSAAFTSPPLDPLFPTKPARQGTFGRNVLRALPVWQADIALGRSFNFTERWKLQFKAEAFNIFNHPNFGSYTSSYTSSSFGIPTNTFASNIGGLNALYQIGGPRSIQLSLKLSF